MCCSEIRDIDGSLFGTVIPDEEFVEDNKVRGPKKPPASTKKRRGSSEGKWSQAVDPTSEGIYYINNDTGETQWETPSDYDGE